MLIGKRPKLKMQRTTSIPRITVGVVDDDDDQTTGQDSDVAMVDYDQRLGMLSPGGRLSSSFLGNCGFCKHRLAPARDIYMYKGDAAFCSIECREQQMKHDKGKTKNHDDISSSK